MVKATWAAKQGVEKSSKQERGIVGCGIGEGEMRKLSGSIVLTLQVRTMDSRVVAGTS